MVMTTTYQVSQPVSFEFTNPEDWPRRLQRFERFRQASRLTEKSEEAQVNKLICYMGDKADNILRSFKLSADDAKNCSTGKEKFQGHFIKSRKKSKVQ